MENHFNQRGAVFSALSSSTAGVLAYYGEGCGCVVLTEGPLHVSTPPPDPEACQPKPSSRMVLEVRGINPGDQYREDCYLQSRPPALIPSLRLVYPIKSLTMYTVPWGYGREGSYSVVFQDVNQA